MIIDFRPIRRGRFPAFLGDVNQDAAKAYAAAGFTNVTCGAQTVTSPGGSYTQNVCSIPGYSEGFDAAATVGLSPAQIQAVMKNQVTSSGAGTNYFSNPVGGATVGSWWLPGSFQTASGPAPTPAPATVTATKIVATPGPAPVTANTTATYSATGANAQAPAITPGGAGGALPVTPVPDPNAIFSTVPGSGTGGGIQTTQQLQLPSSNEFMTVLSQAGDLVKAGDIGGAVSLLMSNYGWEIGIAAVIVGFLIFHHSKGRR